MIRVILDRDGVIGAVFDAWMIQPGWVQYGAENQITCTIDNVVDHIDYICQMAGNANHAAIGTDLDGGYGIEQTPSDLDTIADVQKVAGLLRDRGYKRRGRR